MFDTIIPMIIGLALGFSAGGAVFYFYDAKLLNRLTTIRDKQEEVIKTQKELIQTAKATVVMQKSYINALENKINFSSRKNDFEEVGTVAGERSECGYFNEF